MISLESLTDLRALFEKWGITADDWYVTGEAAMLLSNYPVNFRPGQIDVLMRRSVWPWPRPEEQGSLFPDAGTAAEGEWNAFIQKHGFIPDLHPLPHIGLKEEDRFDHTYWYPDERGVRVLKPWSGVYHRQCIIEFYENDPKQSLAVFDEAKFIRWKKFVQEVREHAAKIDDHETIAMCDQVLPVTDRAIAFFSSTSNENSADAGILKGIGAYPGVITGKVAHWKDGQNFQNKIVVLTHTLPVQVTLLRSAAGIITDQGGTLSHAATIAREYHIPTIIGTKIATQTLKNGDTVSMDAEKGIVTKL